MLLSQNYEEIVDECEKVTKERQAILDDKAERRSLFFVYISYIHVCFREGSMTPRPEWERALDPKYLPEGTDV